MGLIVGVLKIIEVIVGRLLGDEIRDWTPKVVELLISSALTLLPDRAIQDRYREEWLSHINETPGTVSKLATAVGFIFAARKITKSNGPPPLPQWGVRVLDKISYYGTKVVQRSLLKKLEGALDRQFEPALRAEIVKTVQCRFEPILYLKIRAELPQLRNYRKISEEVLQSFSRVTNDTAKDAAFIATLKRKYFGKTHD